MEGAMERPDHFPRVSPPLHSGRVQAITTRVIANGQGKWQRVFHDDRVTANVGLATHSAKLMHAGISSNVRIVLNDHMACQGGGVGHNHSVADDAIVSDVDLRHQ
jgi:hypothetical protein